ncbi:MAG: molybdopterin-dependent oxidoreductase [Candidatus Lokiarchaeota archaeon]|nr:molybdopterin-dependent oxidoreductase [Candidatus Lokiarchaeota archaeon]
MNNQIDIVKRFGTCSKDCYGSCVFMGEWKDKAPEKKFVSAKPLKNHPFTNGFFCPKLNHREKLLYHPNRLKSALLRSGPKGSNTFKPVSLDNALNLISEKIKTVKNELNPSSIAAAFYAGNSGLISQFSPIRFFGRLGCTITTGGICNEAGNHALSQMFGNYSTTNPFQINNPNNKLIVVWGSNLSERNNHAYFLVKKAQENGSLVVVVNPVKTKLEENATLHLQPFPGTDYLIVKYILNKILAAGKYGSDFLIKHVDNYEKVLTKVKKIDEDKIFQHTGLTRESLDAFIKLLCEFQHKTLFVVGFGPQKYFYGGKNLNTIALIQVFLGNFGKLGTGFLFSQSGFNKEFTETLTNYITLPHTYPPYNSIPLVTLGSSLSSSKFKILFVYNLNPASSLPNQTILRKSLSRNDLFVVVLDMFLNETTKFADIVIPAKFDLETDDFITPYFTPGISINQGGPCPYSDCLSNYEFIQLLAKKIGWGNNKIFQETQIEIFDKCVELLPLEVQQRLKHSGYYIPFGINDIPYEDLNFPTANGKIQILSSTLELLDSELDFLLHRSNDEFFLLSPAHKSFIHSQMGEIHKEFENVFGKIFLNPYDIELIGLKPKDKVFVSNKFGEARFILDKKSALKSGTALIYSGLPFANTKYENVNFLTPKKPEESELSGAYFSVLVKITKD